MSEQAPVPKPHPPKESQEAIIARLEKALAEPTTPAPAPLESVVPDSQPAEKPAFTFVDRRNDASKEWSNDMKNEAAQAELDKQLVAVEATPVEESAALFPEDPTPVAAEAPVVVAAALGTELEKPEAPAPKRGELTHHDYHAQRPADGAIYRAGKTYQRAGGGAEPTGFVKNGQEEYDKQNGVGDPNAAQKHYDEVMKTNEVAPPTPERPPYEAMDTDQLIFAYAKAEMIGDKHVTDDIRNVYTTAMEEAYTKPGSPITYEEHEEALARFDRLTDAAIEYEKAKDPAHSALVDAAVERANKEPTVGDKLKKLWAKGKEKVKNLFRPEYWGERFTAAANKIGEASAWALNLGVKETDTPEEADKKRNRNRVLFVAGGAALAVATIAGAYGIGYAVGGGGHHAATEALNNGATGSGHGAGGNVLSAHDQAVADALTPHRGAEAAAVGATGAAAAAAKAQEVAQHAAEAIPAAFNISNGEGGLQLLSNLNIDPSKWATHANDLLAKLPQDFYRMPGGGVGIAHPGLLSPEARNAIEALR